MDSARRLLSFGWGLFAALTGSPTARAGTVRGDAVISALVHGSPLVIRTFDSLAGSIGSLQWAGKEFINAADHGRELQSAVSYDELGECLNPTEAGASYDGAFAQPSTSRLLGLVASGNLLATQTQMAYWLAPGQTDALKGVCGDGSQMARNPTRVSQTVLHKTVKIGYRNLDNVIVYDVAFQVGEAHRLAQFEILTGYLNHAFTYIATYDPASGDQKAEHLALAGSPNGIRHASSNVPVIYATADHAHAMAIYAPQVAESDEEYLGAFVIQGVPKWNHVARLKNVKPQMYRFRNFVVVGTLKQVVKSLNALYQKVEQE